LDETQYKGNGGVPTTPHTPLSHFSKKRKLGVYLPADCLANHENISPLVVGMITLGLLTIFAFFFVAQIDLYAELLLDLRVGNDEAPLVDTSLSLLQLGLGDVVCFEWNNGNYITALGLEIFAGFLPYLRCFMTPFAFFAPRYILPVESRATLLKFLDQITKWCLVGNFAGLFICVGFNFNLEDLAEELLGIPIGPGLVNGVVFGTLELGWYMNFAGTALAHVMNQLVLFLHRMNEEPVPLTKEDEAVPSEPESPRVNWGERLYFNQFVTLVTLLFALILMIRGSMEDSFNIEAEGILAEVLPDADLVKEFSLIDYIVDFPDTAEDPSDPIIQFVLIIMFACAFVIPVVHLVLLGLLYVVPLKTHTQWQLFYAVEILSGWSALDVFVITMPVIGDVPVEFGTVFDDDELPAGVDPETLLISSTVAINAWFAPLLIAAALILGMNYLIVYSVESMVKDRIRLQYHELSIDKSGSFQGKGYEGGSAAIVFK
jgi:hypothetical protein